MVVTNMEMYEMSGEPTYRNYKKGEEIQAEKENQCLNTIRRKMKMNKVNRQRPFGAKG